jgi:translation initiation factor IF-3
MPPIHITSTSRALYRVFIVPTLTTTFRPIPSTLTRLDAFPKITVRGKAYKKPAVRHALSDHFTYDSAITCPRINYIDEKGVFHGNVTLHQVSYNRVTHHLLQLTAEKFDEFGSLSLAPEDLPTCKVISKMDLRAQHQKKLDLERRQASGLGTGPAGKNLELNWAIAGGDLNHRLEKMKEFLKEGRKVEILFGVKRRGKVATQEECEGLVEKVREAVAECKGAGQIKEPEGVMGGVMTMFFQGRKLEGVGDPVKKEEARRGRRVAEREKGVEKLESKVEDKVAEVSVI